MQKLAKIMSSDKKRCTPYNQEENNMEVIRRGPWTLEEDTLLIHYIACHGEGRWNLLARCSGLKRTGKSCRLRWLNYLKPEVKRGNLTPEEQILILELHSKWGNRWSRIAQYLPGRTDNEIKNYWRTRVQKQARQLKIDANSALFHDAVRCFWMPRLLEKIQASSQQLLHSTTQNNIAAHQAMISSSKEPLQPEMRCGHDEFGLYDQMMHENHTPSTSITDAFVHSQWEERSQLITSVPYYQDAMTNDGYTHNPQLIMNGEFVGHIDHNLGFPPALATQGLEGTSSTSEFSMMENNSIDANMEEGFWNMDESLIWQARKLLEWGI